MTNRRDVLALGILGGTVIAALALACTFGGGRMARAESAPLALDVYTADAQGIGVTSTLIYGNHEAILVDTQFRISDADKLADRIAAKGRRLCAAQALSRHTRLRERLRYRVHQGRPRKHRCPNSRALRRGYYSRRHPD